MQLDSVKLLQINRLLRACVVALCLFAAQVGGAATDTDLLESQSLYEPTTKLSDVLPQEVLEKLKNPADSNEPLKLATRKTLDWQSGAAPKSDSTLSDITESMSGPILAPAKSGLVIEIPDSDSEKSTEDASQEKLTEPAPVLAPKAPKKLPNPSEQAAKKAEKAPVAEEKPADIAEAAPTAKQQEPPAPLPRNLKILRSRMRTVISYYYRKPLNNVEYDPWEIMHSMLSFELHSRVRDGGPRGKPMTAVGFLCYNMPAERKKMLRVNSKGELDARIGVGLQGHKGQLLAMLAQCNVSPDYPIRVSGKEFTIHDLIESEQKTCQSRTELTFKLIGLGHYLSSDANWLDERGETWDIPRLIREERNMPIRGSACGGTHRLAGLSLAYQRREARNEPIDGEYLEAKNFIKKYQQYAFRLQNRDGSYSTEWFRGRGDEDDIERRIRTTGHTLEWLIYSLSDDELRSNSVVRGATYLTNLLATYSNQDWHKGSLGHALHALVLYDKRVFQPHDGTDKSTMNIVSDVNPQSSKYRGYAVYRGVLRGQSQPKDEEYSFGLFGIGRRH